VKVLFVMERRVDAGSIHAVANHIRAADEAGHTMALYGRPDRRFPGIRFAVDATAFDHVVFLVESSLSWMSALRIPAILERVPRSRRAVLDVDGMYNPLICVDGYDRNYAAEAERASWLAHYAMLADRVFQPTVGSHQPRVVPVPFYGYDPASTLAPEASPPKRVDVMHVGHNWWRGRELSRLLPALERIRDELDGVCFLGSWWDRPPAGADELGLEAAFATDSDWLSRLRIEVRPPVPFTDVIREMSVGRVNLMTQRPLFRQLRILTSKYFEIFCADTIPLVLLDADHAEAIYGSAGRELSLDYGVEDKLLDALASPGKYREIVEEVRRHLIEHHSYRRRVEELVSALASSPEVTGSAQCG
jgi:hypothetical protein